MWKGCNSVIKQMFLHVQGPRFICCHLLKGKNFFLILTSLCHSELKVLDKMSWRCDADVYMLNLHIKAGKDITINTGLAVPQFECVCQLHVFSVDCWYQKERGWNMHMYGQFPNFFLFKRKHRDLKKNHHRWAHWYYSSLKQSHWFFLFAELLLGCCCGFGLHLLCLQLLAIWRF